MPPTSSACSESEADLAMAYRPMPSHIITKASASWSPSCFSTVFGGVFSCQVPCQTSFVPYLCASILAEATDPHNLAAGFCMTFRWRKHNSAPVQWSSDMIGLCHAFFLMRFAFLRRGCFASFFPAVPQSKFSSKHVTRRCCQGPKLMAVNASEEE